ncbi:hypothetical protein [Photobacterium phosphoreum]|uniref:hypothetical protein n=1 Tax=Photobacterium phosphoreum TaxID=659 RepID=UPI001E561899|nr:hypothetical protein [Photobacterium phosphoreum]MCD9472923.1 hypothetical protein [Photobacterium phosphoreum]
MKLVSKAFVESLSNGMGLVVLELDDCTRWSMIDRPFHNVNGAPVHVYRDGRKFYVGFNGESERFAVDEM